MHGYFWDKKRLEKRLGKFQNGQFLMETKEGLMFRGEIKECVIPAGKNRRVLIAFNWLCERRFILNEWWKPVPKWVRLESPIGSSHLDVIFSTYYIQYDEERLKMWGELGEVCRFFKKDDHTNLVRTGDEIVSYWELHKFNFFRAIQIAVALKKK